MKKVKKQKAFIGAVISGVSSLVNTGLSIANAIDAKKQAEKQAALQNKQDTINNAKIMSANLNNAGDIEKEFNERITLRGGGRFRNRNYVKDSVVFRRNKHNTNKYNVNNDSRFKDRLPIK